MATLNRNCALHVLPRLQAVQPDQHLGVARPPPPFYYVTCYCRSTGQAGCWKTHAVWSRQRTAALDVKHSKSLAVTIELSLASLMFEELGSDTREFLEVMAFFWKGVNEENIRWQYPTISDVPKTLDEFYGLSLSHGKNGFIATLKLLRDHLRPILKPARL